MSRGDSGYMSSEDGDGIDIFEKLKEKLKEVDELYRARSSEPSFVDQRNGSRDNRHNPRLMNNHNHSAPPFPRNKSPLHASLKVPPSETQPNNRTYILSEQQQLALISPSLMPLPRPPVSGSTTPIYRETSSLMPDVYKMRQLSAPNSPPLLPLPRHPVSGSTTPIYQETSSSISDVYKMRQQSAPSSPPLLPLPRPIHRETSSLMSDVYKMRQQSAPSSPPLLSLPRHPVSGSTTPIYQETSSSIFDFHKINQLLAPRSPPLLPPSRYPISRPTTPTHRETALQGCAQVTSSGPSSPPLFPPTRHPQSIPVTEPTHRRTASQDVISSTSDNYKMRQQSTPRSPLFHPQSTPVSRSTTPIQRVAASSSPPLFPTLGHSQSVPVSRSTTPIHRVAACNQITSTPDVRNIRQALLNHRKITLTEAPPPELFDMPDEPSSPMSPEVPFSPFDFRDLIEQYYDDLDEIDTDEEKKLLEETAAKNRKREAAVKEIITTERTYVDGLKKCVDYFLKPLRDNCQKSNHRHTLLSTKPVVTLDEISLIFGNIKMILSLHEQLLKSLEERYSNWSPTNLISDIFLQNAPFLKMYTVYVKNFPRAIELTERLKKGSKDFRKFMQLNQGRSELGGLSFNSFLSLPIQRIPRYKLLLEALLKHTDESHPDYPNLENCVKQITVIADEVNEKIRDGENQNKVLEIQTKVERCPVIVNPARRFIHEGDLLKVLCRYTAKKTSYFATSETLTHYLFNDLLLCCSKVQGRIIYYEQIDLNYASVANIEDKLSDKPFCFEIVVKTQTDERHHLVRALDECTKSDWISKLEDAIRALKNGNTDGRRLIPIRQISQSSPMTADDDFYIPNPVAFYI